MKINRHLIKKQTQDNNKKSHGQIEEIVKAFGDYG